MWTHEWTWYILMMSIGKLFMLFSPIQWNFECEEELENQHKLRSECIVSDWLELFSWEIQEQISTSIPQFWRLHFKVIFYAGNESIKNMKNSLASLCIIKCGFNLRCSSVNMTVRSLFRAACIASTFLVAVVALCT